MDDRAVGWRKCLVTMGMSTLIPSSIIGHMVRTDLHPTYDHNYLSPIFISNLLHVPWIQSHQAVQALELKQELEIDG